MKSYKQTPDTPRYSGDSRYEAIKRSQADNRGHHHEKGQGQGKAKSPAKIRRV